MQPAAVNWVERRARQRRRRDVVTMIGNVVALHALALYVLLTLQRGRLAAILAADHVVTGLVGILVAVDIALVLRPQPVATVIGRVVTLLGKLVLRPVTTLLLVVVWVTTWPLARTVGRSGVSRRHPGMIPWVSRTAEWQGSTWVAKTSEAVSANRRSGPHLLRVVGWFVDKRSFFTLLVVILLLVALSLSVAAQTPTLAPFIYTLF